MAHDGTLIEQSIQGVFWAILCLRCLRLDIFIMQILNAGTETVLIDSITPHEQNPNQGARAAIAQSIEANGFYGFVICQRSRRRILIGEHRWRELRDRGADTVPVLWLDVDDDAARRIMLADNRTGRLGQDDETLLLAVSQWRADASTLDGTGYTDDDLADLTNDLADVLEALDSEPPVGDTTPAPELTPSDTVVKVGEHRFIIERQAYIDWLEQVRGAVGFEPAAIRDEIRTRLGIPCAS